MQKGRPIDPKSLDELRGAVAGAIEALAPTHREHVMMLGRLIASAAESAAPPAGEGAPPPPPRPAFERLVVGLRAELDRQGIAVSERRRSRIPLVPVRPWRAGVDGGEDENG
jgi:hypothetical protein